MSRSYRILGGALVGLLLLAGLVKLAEGGDDRASGRPSDSIAANSTAASTTAASTTAATSTTTTSTTTTTTTPVESTAPDTTTGDLIPGGSVTDEVDGDVSTTSSPPVTDGSGGIWTGPPGPPPAVDGQCPEAGHAAIIDRANQAGWLCAAGVLTAEFPLTSAWSQPDPGTYDVYAKDLKASSNLSGKYSTMTHFVAFTRGKYKGARIAFHSVPKYSNGDYVQPLESVGDETMHGQSAGCLRVLPDDAVRIWNWLALGDSVVVIS